MAPAMYATWRSAVLQLRIAMVLEGVGRNQQPRQSATLKCAVLECQLEMSLRAILSSNVKLVLECHDIGLKTCEQSVNIPTCLI
ncbi:hypothetical protein KCV06_g188, partial [Aureobasidium melanogenum]